MMPKVTVDKDKCNGDGICVSVCPVSVFEMQNEKSVPVNQDACIVCRACETQCPTQAITVEE
ncbi:ferredoxin family protein [Candidatus Bathyarchaeota archaeon]|nr:ferredoxin family protein [Candidatus Bathyarchaeota archaeon]